MRFSVVGTSLRLCVALYAAAAAACGPTVVVKTGEVDASDVNLIALARIYARAQQQLGRPPRSADELRPYAKGDVDLEKLLVSPNDNQPYVVVWGTNLL